MQILWFLPKNFYLNTDSRSPNQKVPMIVKIKHLYLLSYTKKLKKLKRLYRNKDLI